MDYQTVVLMILALESIAVILMAMNQRKQARYIALLYKAMSLMIDITGDLALGSEEDKERAKRVYIAMAEDKAQK